MNPGRLAFSLPRPYETHDPMLGRMKLSLPVCTLRVAPPWAAFVPWIECRKQMSSTHPATCGKSSLTCIPLEPYFLNFQGEASRFPVELKMTLGRANGKGLPWSRCRRGL